MKISARPRWLTPRMHIFLSELELGEAPRWLGPDRSPFGANCAVSRAAFDGCGGFRPGLDRVGQSLVSNGDTEFFDRVRAAGGRILYWPSAAVQHRVPATRLTREWFIRRARAQGASDLLVDRPRARAIGLVRELPRLARVVPILVRNIVMGRGTTSAAVWLAYCRGRAGAILGRNPRV